MTAPLSHDDLRALLVTELLGSTPTPTTRTEACLAAARLPSWLQQTQRQRLAFIALLLRGAALWRERPEDVEAALTTLRDGVPLMVASLTNDLSPTRQRDDTIPAPAQRAERQRGLAARRQRAAERLHRYRARQKGKQATATEDRAS